MSDGARGGSVGHGPNARPPHPATVVQSKAPHPATVPGREQLPPHPATVAQPKARQSAMVRGEGRPPHPATVAQPKTPLVTPAQPRQVVGAASGSIQLIRRGEREEIPGTFPLAGAGALQMMIKKKKLPPLLPLGDASDFIITNDTFTTITPNATVKKKSVVVCNGGVSMTATVQNTSEYTWEVGFLQAVLSYQGQEIYEHNTVTYAFKTVPIKDAAKGSSVFYDGSSKASIAPGKTKNISFMDAPEAEPSLTDNSAGNLVSVERHQTFILWLWARRNTRDRLLLKTYHWGINSSYDVKSNQFTINNPIFGGTDPKLATIMSQKTTANDSKNLSITIT